MKIQSFIRDKMGLRPIEVEVSLTPGIPKIQFLGLPDATIKESVLRIQSALKHCGFALPKSKQILVNLKPNYLKKSSRGMDLAVAAGILWEIGQAEKPETENVSLYGELSLKGEVLVPDDFEDLELPPRGRFYTGKIQSSQGFDIYSLSTLKDIAMPVYLAKTSDSVSIERPKTPDFKITKKQSELIEIIAAGEHPAMLAGPPGSGKTTMAMIASTLLKDPLPQELKSYQKVSRYFGIPIDWRPVVSPHHTSTALAMIGGGPTPRPGEITRAHGGTLIMDEFLEFDSHVQEALREPMESGKITISRTGNVSIFPAQFLLMATTNLCPCGYLVPEKDFECRGRVRFCHSRLQKLSGPMMDRFSVLAFSHEWKGDNDISARSLLPKILKAIEFRKTHRNQKISNHFMEISEIEKDIEDFDKEFLLPTLGNSHRRYQSLLRVARTIADLEESEKIKTNHIKKALSFTLDPFNKIKDYIFKY
jgi:magnesium chelatase family protein